MSTGRVLAICAALVAGLAVAVSIWLNPPSENRARAMDAERIWRLGQIERAINDYYRLRQKLPSNLEELEADNSELVRENLLDPNTGAPFGYEVVGEQDYRLCAIFERSTDVKSHPPGIRKHKAGRDCFDNKVIVPRP